MRRSAVLEGPRCPYCHLDVGKLDLPWRCPGCETEHHKECAEEHGGCTLLGCGVRIGDRTAPPRRAPATCLYCRDAVLADAWRCPSCNTSYHPDCALSDGCVAPACPGRILGGLGPRPGTEAIVAARAYLATFPSLEAYPRGALLPRAGGVLAFASSASLLGLATPAFAWGMIPFLAILAASMVLALLGVASLVSAGDD